jgi:hypothetical protein
MDISLPTDQLATQALALVQVYGLHQLGRAADALTDKAVEAAGSVYGWLKKKLVGLPAAALEEAARKPDDETAIETLRLQLRRLLADDEALRTELAALLPPAKITGPAIKFVQTMHDTGPGSINVQAGHGAKIDVRRG